MAFFRRFLPVAPEAHLEAPDLLRPMPEYDPQGLRGRLNRVFHRRLLDRIEDVFQDACTAGDLTTAEELLTVLENMQRRRGMPTDERRAGDDPLSRARAELARRRQAAQRHPRRA